MKFGVFAAGIVLLGSGCHRWMEVPLHEVPTTSFSNTRVRVFSGSERIELSSVRVTSQELRGHIEAVEPGNTGLRVGQLFVRHVFSLEGIQRQEVDQAAVVRSSGIVVGAVLGVGSLAGAIGGLAVCRCFPFSFGSLSGSFGFSFR